jgi:CubicO group peptidase (beta-lactamase class C family)
MYHRSIKFIIVFAFILLSNSCKKKDVALVTNEKKEEIVVVNPNTMNKFVGNLPKIRNVDQKRIENNILFFYNKRFIPNDFSGSMLVAKNGHILFERYRGMSNFEKKEAITPETPLHIASLSKVFTATAILLLVDAKKLELDQKVNTLLDNFPYDEITVRTLLNHRSGLRNYGYFTDKKAVWNPREILHNSDLIPIINTHNIDLEYKTNTHFAYCNTNYAFLALIIEKVMQKDYTTAMNELIFKPLDMKNTFVFDYEKHRDTVSQSYKGHKIKYAFTFLDAIYGDKNIYSTPRDILKFDMATYHPEFLNKELINEVYSGYSYESKGQRNYGLGIRLFEWENGKKMFYHNGWWHGNTAAYIKLKDEKTTLICLSNKYTRATYKLKLLTGLFGNYPYEMGDD